MSLDGEPCGVSDREADDGSAVGVVAGEHGAAVSFDDLGNDGEAEARSGLGARDIGAQKRSNTLGISASGMLRPWSRTERGLVETTLMASSPCLIVVHQVRGRASRPRPTDRRLRMVNPKVISDQRRRVPTMSSPIWRGRRPTVLSPADHGRGRRAPRRDPSTRVPRNGCPLTPGDVAPRSAGHLGPAARHWSADW